MAKVFEGQLSAAGLRFAIVVSRFNSFITERLLAGAMDALTRTGAAADLIDIVKVPGSWEIPLVAGELARQHRYDAVICLSARDPRRDAAFRLRGGRSRQGRGARRHRNRRAGGVRRADHQYAGAGHRPRRRQGRQQGLRCRHDAPSKWPTCCAPSARPPNAFPPQVAGSARLQILFLWDARRQPVDEAIDAYYDTLLRRGTARARRLRGRAWCAAPWTTRPKWTG